MFYVFCAEEILRVSRIRVHQTCGLVHFRWFQECITDGLRCTHQCSLNMCIVRWQKSLIPYLWQWLWETFFSLTSELFYREQITPQMWADSMRLHTILNSDFIQVVTVASLYMLGSLVFPPILPVHIAFLATVPLGLSLEDPVQVLLLNTKTMVLAPENLFRIDSYRKLVFPA